MKKSLATKIETGQLETVPTAPLPTTWETNELNTDLLEYMARIKHAEMVRRLNETGEKNRVIDAFKELQLLINIGIQDQLSYEIKVMAFLTIIDNSNTHPVFKTRYRNKLINIINRQRKHKLEEQALSDIKKFIRLRRSIDEVAHYQLLSQNVKKPNSKDLRRRIKKLLKIYKDNHTDHDTGTELAQVFSILTTQAIFELSQSPKRTVDQSVKIVKFYSNLVDKINFDNRMNNQKNKHAEIMMRKIRNRRA